LGSHSFLWLTGPTLKKIAITEMKHAEAIAERIVQLGGEPTTKPSPITIGKTTGEILEIDKAAEVGAVQLYSEIVNMAIKEGDGTTENLFNKILSDENNHLKTFSSLLDNG
jgi:bacterioferritin